MILAPYLPLAGLILALTLTAANAETRRWSHLDWAATATTVDTGEDVRTTCDAFTERADGQRLSASISDGDAPPPVAWPHVAFRWDRTPPLGAERSVRWIFDNGVSLTARVVGADGQGTEASPDPRNHLIALISMRASQRLEVLGANDQVIGSASLAGFTAAYRKIAAWCGFPTTIVAP